MRKVIKILLHTISALILVVITLPVFAALLLHLGTVQNFAVKKAAQWAGGKLGTTVSLEKIHIRFFNRVVVDGFYVEDLSGGPLLRVDHLDVALPGPSILFGRLNFGEVLLDGVSFDMKQEADSTSNFKKIIEILRRDKPEEEKVPVRITAERVLIHNMSYSFTKLQGRQREGVDFGDISVSDFNLDAAGFSVVGDSISIIIRDLTLREQSGFTIDAFSARYGIVSPAGILFDDLRIKSGSTDLDIQKVRMKTESWDSYQNYVNVVDMDANIRRSDLSFATIGYFAPVFKDSELLFTGFDATGKGTVSALSGSVSNLDAHGSRLALEFTSRGLPDYTAMQIDANVKSLDTNAESLEQVLSMFGVSIAEGRASESLKALGGILLTGNFRGSISDFETSAEIETGAGEASLDLTYGRRWNNRNGFFGNVSFTGLDLGRILDNSDLGRVTITAGAAGAITDSNLSANVTARMTSGEYRDYTYHNITMNGMLNNRQFRGNIGSTDPNLRFDFDGMLDFNDSIPRYDFNLKLFNADLVKLNLNRKDSVSLLRADIIASASGTNPDDLNGRISIEDLHYINTNDSIQTGRMTITGENSLQSKYLAFRSPFADADYRSRTGYSEVIDEIKALIRTYMPTFSPDDDNGYTPVGPVADASNYSLLNLNIKEANNVFGLFVPGLVIAKNSHLSFMLNPNIGRLSLAASSEYVEFGERNFISSLDVNTRNQGDSVSLFIRAEDIFASGIYMPNFSLIGGLKDNRINANVRFADSTRNLSALVGVSTILGREPESGRPQARIFFTPSSIRSGDNSWNISSRAIVADSTGIDIGRFSVSGSGQSLVAEGRLSREREDTLHVDLRNFDLKPITQLTSRLGYEVTGRTHGHVDMISGLENGIMYAQIMFDSVALNGHLLPRGYFSSTWDFERERARFDLSGNEDATNPVITGFYNPADYRYAAHIDMPGVDVSLLDPLFSGVIRDTRGIAHVKAELGGQGRFPLFNGTVEMPSFRTTVDFTNVEYTMPDVVVNVRDNVLLLDKVPLYDPYGNSANVDMKVDLSMISNVNYTFNIRPQRLLAINTTLADNEIFYGKVFASGAVNVAGNKLGVNLDIAATTENGSEFHLPLNIMSNLGVSEVITFWDPNARQEADSSAYSARKRQIISGSRRRRFDDEQSNLNVNMAVNVLDNTAFEIIIDERTGNIMRGRGNGSLSIGVNPVTGDFTMNGIYEITEGVYQFALQEILNKRFIIEQGSTIRWINDPLEAQLDVTAVYRLKASLGPLLNLDDVTYRRPVPVECRVMLTGRLMQPEISFNVSVPDAAPEVQSLVANALSTQENMASQFIFLVAANTFYTDYGAAGIGAASGQTIAYDFLFNQINNLLTNDFFSLGFGFTPATEDTSNEFNIDISTNLFKNRLLLEAEGNIDAGRNNGVSSTNSSNITGDFYLTWLIDRAGNLRAKGFTRTIDRFDEQGLQENGIGLYYTESFNTVGDIVRNFKDRFSGWGRKKKRLEALLEEEQTQEDASK